jgi:hypothetical protein
LTEEVFLSFTPAKLTRLDKRRRLLLKEKRETTEFLFGQLTSWVANTGFRSTKEPTKITDFMPSQWGKKTTPQPKKTKRWTKQQRHRMFLDLRQALGGN